MNGPIPTFIVNKKERKDRLTFITNQFNDKIEFRTQILNPIEHEVGAVSLWNTLRAIVEKQREGNVPFFLLCEDDHQFTSAYSQFLLTRCLKKVKTLEGDLLLGGVSCFANCIKVSKDLFWVDDFTGLQFSVIYKNLYDKILDVDFTKDDAADCKISTITDSKFVIFPFISVQKEFGYSDVTPYNNLDGRVTKLFGRSDKRLTLINKVNKHYLGETFYHE